MIPRTDIIYNYDYAKRLHRGGEHFEEVWRRILALGADFEEIHAEYGEHILELIERYTGYPWEEYVEEFFPIYIADSAPSFARPFTLTIDEDPVAMLRDCVYQLAHRNMSFGFRSEELRHHCLELVTSQIMCDLKLQKQQTADWDVRTKTIKEYLNK